MEYLKIKDRFYGITEEKKNLFTVKKFQEEYQLGENMYLKN